MNDKWTAIPARRSKRQDANFRAMVVIGLLLACAGLGLLSTFAWLSADKSSGEVKEEPILGAGVALAAAQDFLSGRDTNMPRIPDTGDPLEPPSAQIATAGPWPHNVRRDSYYYPELLMDLPVEIHQFLFDDGGTLRILEVTILIQPDLLPVVVGTPVVAPLILPEAGTTLKLQGEEVFMSEAVKEKVMRWAVAYFEDRRTELADIAGNPAGDYQGLGGWTVNEVTVLRYHVSLGFESTHVARVMVEASRSGVKLTQVFELAVREDSQVPTIVGWGPVGSFK